MTTDGQGKQVAFVLQGILLLKHVVIKTLE